MPIVVERSAMDSVIIYRYEGSIVPADIRAARQQAVALVAHSPDVVYRVHDTRKIKLDFSQGIDLLAAMVSDEPGSSGDARFREIAVVNDNLVRMLTESLSQAQYGSVQVHLTSDLEEAMDYVNQCLNGSAD